MSKYCFVNGKIVPEREAKINVFDLGLLRCFSAFDFLRTYGGKPFLLDYHLDRFENSAKLLGLKIPYSREKISEIISSVIKKNNLKETGIDLILTGGQTKDGLKPDGKSTFLVLPMPLPKWAPDLYTKGAKVITCEHQREMSCAKSTNYLTMLCLREAKIKKGAAEIIYASGGNILEGAASSFFIFKKDKLITAKENVLPGTRRRLIIKLAKNHFKIEEKEIKLEELKESTEAFITSSSRDIMPVIQIDNVKIGNGKVGENTKYLMAKFQEFVRKGADASSN